MARFYISVRNGHPTTSDEPIEFPNEAAAIQDAIRTCGEILKDASRTAHDESRVEVTVGDDSRAPIFVIRAEGQRPRG